MDKGARIGFVGIGNMGAPMAVHIANAGYCVVAFDTRPDIVAALAAQNANIEVAQSLNGAGSDVSAVITMLPDSKVVEAVVFGSGAGAGGALSSVMAPDSLLIDMSSSFAPATRALAQRLQEKGIWTVDAPVSGGVGKAVSGELAIMAGGRDEDVARARPLLETMGTVFHTGPVGSGHAMKALNNYVSAAGLIAVSEALAVGETFGLQPQRMVEILNASTGRNNTSENKAERYMLSGTYNSGFSLALMAKDVGMAQELAQGLGIEARELELVSRYLSLALSELGAGADHTEVHRFVRAANDDA